MTETKSGPSRVKHTQGRKRFDVHARAAILELLEQGATHEDAAAAVGLTVRTSNRYAAQHAEWREAIDAALDVGAWLRDTTTKFTEEIRELWLDQLRDGVRPAPAARKLGLDWSNVRKYIARDDVFRARMGAALSEAVDRVEHSVFENAIVRHDQRAGEFILKNLRKTKYRDVRLIGVGGINGEQQPEGPIEVEVDEKAITRDRLARAFLDPRFTALAHEIEEAQRDDESDADG